MARSDQKLLEKLLGRDLRLDYAFRMGFFEDADLASGKPRQGVRRDRDLLLTEGVDNLTQAVANRIKTRKGELASLGHPDYGSRHHELIGEPNVERTRNLIKFYVLQALRDEPRIERVIKAKVMAEHDPPRETVRIELQLQVIGESKPLNLIVPFSLGVGV
jgi:phage baseplate assembly protein W